MHRIAAAALGSVLLLAACSTADAGSSASRPGSSAAAARSAARGHPGRVCTAVRGDLAVLASLAGRLVEDPTLRIPLADQVGAAVRRLATKIGGNSAEWQAVLDASGDLVRAMRGTNEAAIRLAASQVVLAVRLAQAGCAAAAR
jgi:hypothetical protein